MTATVDAKVAASDRRIATRRQPTFGTVCRVTLPGGDKPILGLVWNLSTSGVSMLLTDPPPAGTVLSGNLETITREAVLPVAMKVVHVKKIETGDYLMGAAFQRPLVAGDMTPFVT